MIVWLESVKVLKDKKNATVIFRINESSESPHSLLGQKRKSSTTKKISTPSFKKMLIFKYMLIC